MENFPIGKYNIIYLDPPWSYRDKANAGKRGVSYKYDLMSMEDICNLPIQDIADDNCCLFMWATMPLLEEIFVWNPFAFWGFKYKTNAFTWVKLNKKKPTWFWSMGNWTRSNAELCLLATRGKPVRQSARVHSIIMHPVMEHSRKPPIVRDEIVKLCGDLPRIELFSREKVEGWDYWGNEVDKF